MKLPALFPRSYEAVSTASAGLLKHISVPSTGSRGNKRSSVSSGGQASRGFLRSWPQRIFLALVVLEAAFLVTTSAMLLRNRFWRWHLDLFTRTVFVNGPSMIILTLEAFKTSSLEQLVGVSILNIPLFIYHIVQRSNAHAAYFQNTTNPLGMLCTEENINEPECAAFRAGWTDWVGLLTAAPVLVAVCQIIYCYLTWLLAAEFGWTTFRLLGGDMRLRQLQAWSMRLATLLKIDFFFFALHSVGMTIYSAEALRDKELSFTVHVVAGIVFGLQYLILATPLLALLALVKEVMYAALVFLAAGTATLLPLIWVYIYAPSIRSNWYSFIVREFMIVLTTIDATLVLLTVVVGVYVTHAYFGAGLLEATARGRAQGEAARASSGAGGGRRARFSLVSLKGQTSEDELVEQGPARMVIE